MGQSGCWLLSTLPVQQRIMKTLLDTMKCETIPYLPEL